MYNSIVITCMNNCHSYIVICNFVVLLAHTSTLQLISSPTVNVTYICSAYLQHYELIILLHVGQVQRQFHYYKIEGIIFLGTDIEIILAFISIFQVVKLSFKGTVVPGETCKLTLVKDRFLSLQSIQKSLENNKRIRNKGNFVADTEQIQVEDGKQESIWPNRHKYSLIKHSNWWYQVFGNPVQLSIYKAYQTLTVCNGGGRRQTAHYHRLYNLCHYPQFLYLMMCILYYTQDISLLTAPLVLLENGHPQHY